MNTAEDYRNAAYATSARLARTRALYLAALDAKDTAEAERRLAEIGILELRAAHFRRRAWLAAWGPVLLIALVMLATILLAVGVWL